MRCPAPRQRYAPFEYDTGHQVVGYLPRWCNTSTLCAHSRDVRIHDCRFGPEVQQELELAIRYCGRCNLAGSNKPNGVRVCSADLEGVQSHSRRTRPLGPHAAAAGAPAPDQPAQPEAAADAPAQQLPQLPLPSAPPTASGPTHPLQFPLPQGLPPALHDDQHQWPMPPPGVPVKARAEWVETTAHCPRKSNTQQSTARSGSSRRIRPMS